MRILKKIAIACLCLILILPQGAMGEAQEEIKLSADAAILIARRSGR